MCHAKIMRTPLYCPCPIALKQLRCIRIFFWLAAVQLDCQTRGSDHRNTLFVLTISLLGMCAIRGCMFLPILIKFVNGTRKLFVVLQELSIIIFFLILVLKYGITTSAHKYDVKKFSYKDDFHNPLTSYYINVHLISLFQSVFYYKYYLLSLMQSFDIFQMVHHPLDYSEFCTIKNIAKYILLGIVACIVLSSGHICHIGLYLFYRYKPLIISNNKVPKNEDNIEMFSMIIFVVFKVSYPCLVGTLAYKVKRSLTESEGMAETNEAKRRVHRRLFWFTTIPIFMNFFFLLPEILSLLAPMHRSSYKKLAIDCNSFIRRKEVQVSINAVMVMIGSFSYFVGYVLLIKKIRAFIFCKKDNLHLQ